MPKAGIHPTYYPNATVTCSCGETHTIGSTKETLKVEICSNCHPFYSGNQKLIDTAGRVDRFRERVAAAEARQPKAKKAEPAPVVIEEAPTEAPADDADTSGKEQE